MKRTSLLIATLAALAVALTASASAAKGPTLTLRHQLRGCHSWSLNGGPFKVAQTVHLKRGQTLTVVDDDVMPHLLYRESGAKTFALRSVASAQKNVKTDLKGPGLMAHMGASLELTFKSKGVFVFGTKGGEDYTPNVKTIGEDNVLRLKIVVS